jgi:hypothetical protein
MTKKFILICLVFIGCKKPINNKFICTCKTTVKISQGFTTEALLVDKKAYPVGSISESEAKRECNGHLFWLGVGNTFWITNATVGNGYVPSSQVICNL